MRSVVLWAYALLLCTRFLRGRYVGLVRPVPLGKGRIEDEPKTGPEDETGPRLTERGADHETDTCAHRQSAASRHPHRVPLSLEVPSPPYSTLRHPSSSLVWLGRTVPSTRLVVGVRPLHGIHPPRIIARDRDSEFTLESCPLPRRGRW